MITGCTSGQTIYLDTVKFLPDIDQAEFLQNLINMFNLYFTIDINNKIISFETYDTFFTNKVDPFDITDKVLLPTVKIEKAENSDFNIEFKDADNMKCLGDDLIIGDNNESLNDVVFKTSTEVENRKVFNYIGTTNNKIEVGFGVPAMKRMYIWNEKNVNDVDFQAGITSFILPNISKQTPKDNNSKNFNKNPTDTNVYNTEDTIQHKGNPSLYFYYGLSDSDFIQTDGVGASKNYFYVYMDEVNQKIPIVSPFIYTKNRGNLINTLTGSTTSTSDDVLASYIEGNYLMLGDNHTETNFSLIFGDNSNYGDTLFTKFYVNKYRRYKYGEILNLSMLMNNSDWNTLQINKPVKYKSQIYSIISITNYDIVKGMADVKLIKQI